MRILTTCLTAAVLTTSLYGQQTTITPSNAANSNNIFPFNYQPGRYMQVHDAAGFTNQTPLTFKGMRYAPNSTTSNSGSVEIMVRLALAASGTTSANAVSTYATNIDSSTVKTVIARKKLNVPGGAGGAFVIHFPFDSGTSFVYVPQANRSLCVETRVYSGKANFPFSAWSGLNLNNGSTVTNGSYQGCKSASQSTVAHYGISAYLKADGVYGKYNYLYGYAYAQSIPGVMTLGGTTLSATLPGTSCMLINDILAMGVGVTDTSTQGRLQFNLPIPAIPSLAGAKFLTQMFFLEASANPLGITSTRGLINTIGKGMIGVPTTVCRIYGFSSSPDTLTSGSVGRNFGIITQFHD